MGPPELGDKPVFFKRLAARGEGLEVTEAGARELLLVLLQLALKLQLLLLLLSLVAFQLALLLV